MKSLLIAGMAVIAFSIGSLPVEAKERLYGQAKLRPVDGSGVTGRILLMYDGLTTVRVMGVATGLTESTEEDGYRSVIYPSKDCGQPFSGNSPMVLTEWEVDENGMGDYSAKHTLTPIDWRLARTVSIRLEDNDATVQVPGTGGLPGTLIACGKIKKSR